MTPTVPAPRTLASRAVRAAARGPLWLAAVALSCMALLTFADVILRSVADAPIPAAAELTEVLLAITVFAALPATALGGRQISVDLLDGFLGARAVRLRNAALEIIFGCLLYWPVAKVWTSAFRTLGYGEVTLYLRIPVGWLLMIIGTGFTLAALMMVLRGVVMIVRPDAALLKP